MFNSPGEICHFFDRNNFDKYKKGVSTSAIKILKIYVPKIYIIITLYKVSGSGFNTIQAKRLNTVLSNKDDKLVDKLFLNYKYLLDVKFLISE